MFLRTVIVLAAALGIAGVGGCGSRDAGDDAPLARVGSRAFYDADLDERLEMMSPMSRGQFEGPAGRRQLLERLVEEEAFYQAAREAGFEKAPRVIEEVEKVRRTAMLRNYYNQEIREKAKPGPQDIEEYYRAHLEEFRTEPRARIRHVLTRTEKEAERIRGLAESGRDFENLASTYSIDDKTKDSGGLIPGYLSPGHQVPLLGEVPELVNAAVELSEEGDIGPVVKSSLGYHVIRAEEIHPGGLIPLDDVRSQIENRETERRAAELYDQKLLELTEQLGIRYNEEQLKPESVQELFDNAQNAKTPKQRIRYYERVLQMYPDDPRAYEAQFMIGFTYAEEMENFQQAKTAFEAVLGNYPESDLAESARWMLENLGREDVPEGGPEIPEGILRVKKQ